MVVVEAMRREICMAGELFAGDREVISAGLDCVDPEQPAGEQYHVGLSFYIEKAVLRNEGEIEISHIMVNRPSA